MKFNKTIKRYFKRKLLIDHFKETHINRAIKATGAQTYLEIGVRNGDGFHQIKAPRKIGVDPDRQNYTEKYNEIYYEQKSDDFFAQEADILFTNNKIDIALVDGLHEFQQALKDIINIFKYISENGYIFIHDCNPPTEKHESTRDGSNWNGDVWKTLLYLKKHHPELKYFTLDCDFGVGVVYGFSQLPAPLSFSPEKVSLCKSLDYNYLNTHRQEVLNLKTRSFSRTFFK